MRVAALIHRRVDARTEVFLTWVDPFAGRVEHVLPVPDSPNLGIFPRQDCALIAYPTWENGKPPQERLDVYRLSDWTLRARLPMDYRAHFNSRPVWSTYVQAPDGQQIYVYKARTLGHHLADDWLCGLDLGTLTFAPWGFKVPECVAGWSAAGGRAHAQMLFVSDGLEVGQLPLADFEQKVGFWLGPEEGMGPLIALGPRPRVHSDLGHARAILSAPQRPLSVVVCNDGAAHLIDPVAFRYLERQQVRFAPGHAMPIFAAQIDTEGLQLYVGTAEHEARSQGLVERVVVHDLRVGRRQLEWVLDEPLAHMALTADGRYLCGAGSASNSLYILYTRTGRPEAVMPLDGAPVFLLPGD
jgi:hypothetical protein